MIVVAYHQRLLPTIVNENALCPLLGSQDSLSHAADHVNVYDVLWPLLARRFVSSSTTCPLLAFTTTRFLLVTAFAL